MRFSDFPLYNKYDDEMKKPKSFRLSFIYNSCTNWYIPEDILFEHFEDIRIGRGQYALSGSLSLKWTRTHLLSSTYLQVLTCPSIHKPIPEHPDTDGIHDSPWDPDFFDVGWSVSLQGKRARQHSFIF